MERGTLGSDMTLNSEGQLSYTHAGLCLLVPGANMEVRAKGRNLIRSLYKDCKRFYEALPMNYETCITGE